MRILDVTFETVEVLWVDDNEIEIIPFDEFVERFPHIK